jgi:S-adenosylmethionine/arginine decarboxylase-like enzyme
MTTGVLYALDLKLKEMPTFFDLEDFVTSFFIKNKIGVISEQHHFFNGIYAFTYIAILSASHIAVHTWPEHNYMGIDIWSCSDKFDIEKFIKDLKINFQIENLTMKQFERGL